MAGIYLHIPFCKRRCIYCDFYSTTQNEKKSSYINALCRELEERKNYLEGDKIETLYLGGGTPWILELKDIEMVFHTLYSVFISHTADSTIHTRMQKKPLRHTLMT